MRDLDVLYKQRAHIQEEIDMAQANRCGQQEKSHVANLASQTQAMRPMNRDERLKEIFTYHSPGPEQQRCYEAIRDGALFFATTILKNTPDCSDQRTAIDLLRHCVMQANAAVALNGLTL